MVVVDANVLVVALADDGPDGERVRVRLRGEHLAAPELIDLEVLSVLRRSERAGALNTRRAALAVRDLRDLPLDRAPHLRGNVTAYDAAYVALAETMGVPLLTADRRLAAAPGLSCAIELLAGG